MNNAFGIGLRSEHYQDVLDGRADGLGRIGWFEVISENYMDTQGRPLAVLEQVRRDRPVALHGVGLSIGSTDPLSPAYLGRLSALIGRIGPVIVSDHLCWTGVGGRITHDLLPLPHTEEAITHVARRLIEVQERLGRQILMENISSYIWYEQSEMPEWEFLGEIVRRSGCGILLDVNNIHVNSVNHGFDPLEFVRNIPGEAVGQIHLAGHTDMGTYLFDTHSAPVCDAVWELYGQTVAHLGREIPTLIERDAEIPPLAVLIAESERARTVSDRALASLNPAAGEATRR
ncbi:MAG: DUF692 domain-containing protein [Deltaproteobacteria bacterium]|nr:DUF692 domain-containing protein [Deltaproteobacteria bacterium]